MTQPMPANQLRDYQLRAVTETLAVSERNPTCLVSPTGSGKTRMAIAILNATTGPALFIVHRRELLIQTDRILQQYGLRHRVTPVTVQGLLASPRRPTAVTLIWDECHTAPADEYRTVLTDYAHARCVGLTATPERGDGRPLGDLFRELVVAASYSELLSTGHLVPCRIVRPDDILSRGLAQDPVAAYLEHGNSGTGFVYAPRIADAQELAERFTSAGVPAVCVADSTPRHIRDTALADLRSGAVRLLVNVACLAEGVDVPSASVCIIARGVGHITPYLQIAGRVLRSSPGKTEAILIDLTGCTHEFGFPTDDRIYSLDGRGIRPAAQSVTVCLMCGGSYASGPVECPLCGFVRPSPTWEPFKIYNVYLRTIYKGAATAVDAKQAEYLRLRNLQKLKGWSLEFVFKEYRKLFGNGLPDTSDITTEERRALFDRLRQIATERGYRPGYAAARYHAILDAWPPRHWNAQPCAVAPEAP